MKDERIGMALHAEDDLLPPVKTTKLPQFPQTLLVATELTTEDMLEIFVKLASDLTYKLERTEKDRNSWKSSFDMYMNAWEREMRPYGFYATHKHHIDSFVITMQHCVKDAVAWKRQELAQLNKDPFWNIPEPVEQITSGEQSDISKSQDDSAKLDSRVDG